MYSIDLTDAKDPIGTCPACHSAILQYTDPGATSVKCPQCDYVFALDPQTRVRGAVYLKAHRRNAATN